MTGLNVFMFILIVLGITFSVKSDCMAQQSCNNCDIWQSKVDFNIKEAEKPEAINFANDKSITDGIECLLKLENKKDTSKIGGATRPNVSQTYGLVSVEVAALYYSSYLFTKKWDHASVIALVDDKGSVNVDEMVKIAFKYYKAWFKKVKAIGLTEARKQKLDPLKGSGVRWY